MPLPGTEPVSAKPNSLLITASFVWLLVSFWNRNDLPGNLDPVPGLHREPVQSRTDAAPFGVRFNGIDYRVEPEYDYSYVIHSVIVNVITVEYDVTWRHGVVEGTLEAPALGQPDREQTRARLAQLLDRLAVLGDVDAGADVADELAVRPGMWRAALQQPPPGTVVALQAELHLVGTARVECRGIGVQRAVEVGRVHVVAPAVADLLFHLAADEVQPALIEPGAALVRAAHPDQHRRGIRGGAEALFAFAQRGLGARPLSECACPAAGSTSDEASTVPPS